MIYLASTSPRRKKLLREAGIEFRTVKPPYEEKPKDGITSPRAVVCDHAKNKAYSVLAKISKGVIIGADTLVFYKTRLIGKPKNLNQAKRILSSLQGRTHQVYTGVALLQVRDHKVIRKEIFYEKTGIHLKKMDQAAIKYYFSQINPLDKAGAYAIQSKKIGIVERAEGSFSNAVGLPMEKLCAKLKMFLETASKKG